MTSSDEIVVGANGSVYVAPVGTAGPTDSQFAPSGAWAEIGLVDENGAQFTDSKDITDIMVWKSFYPARRVVNSRASMVSFSLRTWSKDSISLAFGGGDVTGGGGTHEIDAVLLVGFSGTDSFHLTIGGNESALITRGTNYTRAGIKAAIEGISGITMDVDVRNISDDGFEVEFLDTSNVGAMTVTNATGVTGSVGTLQAGAAPAGLEYIYTPPTPETVDERTMLVVWADGDKDYILHLPKGMVSNEVQTQLQRTDSANLPIEFAVTPDPGDDPWLIFTNDPSFA